MMRHKVANNVMVLGREAGSQMWSSCQVALSNTFHAFSVRISSRNDRNSASSGRTHHQYLCFFTMGGLSAGVITMHLANEVRVWCDVAVQVSPIHVPSMDEIPISQIIVAPNFNLSNPFCYVHHVSILVNLVLLCLLKPQPPRGTLLSCLLPGGATLSDSVHKGCLLDICVAIGRTDGEFLFWARVHVVVHVRKSFSKHPGLVLGLRRAFACALWRALAFALQRALVFALRRAFAFALRRELAFGLLRALAFTLLTTLAFALLRALAFAVQTGLPSAFAFGVGHVVQVHVLRLGGPQYVGWGLWPCTDGQFLRLSGAQCV